MRNLQRYRDGSRTPGKLGPRLSNIAKAQKRRSTRPLTVADVIRLMGSEGTTTTMVQATFSYEAQRPRVIEATVFTAPEVYTEVGWGPVPRAESGWHRAGLRYLEAYLIAYGMPGQVAAGGAEGTPVIHFTIGAPEDGEVDYAFR
jgi:hypothetical protein